MELNKTKRQSLDDGLEEVDDQISQPMQKEYDKEAIDLGEHLSVLDRQQLELLCAKMIARDNDNFALLEAATKFLDEIILYQTIDAAHDEAEESSCVLAESLMPLLDRSISYNNIGHNRNALVILTAVTNAFGACTLEDNNIPEPSEQLVNESEKELRKILDTFIERLEKSWEDVASKFKPSNLKKETTLSILNAPSTMNTLDTYEAFFKYLADWRSSLAPIFGPLFSDSLRIVKKAMLKEEKSAKKVKLSK